MTPNEFLDILLDQDEEACIGNSPRSIQISFGQRYYPDSAFISINPLDPEKTRCDAAVTKYRNILVEMDRMPLNMQDQYISEIDMPYSTAVFSGKKSIHYIISLEEPLQDEQVYRALVRRVYKAVGDDYVDHSCKNPSRFSRFPGHIRSDTGTEQKLLAVKSRVPLSTLEAWLEKRGAPAEEIWENLSRELRSAFKDPTRLSGSTKNFLMFGAPSGEWNLALFKAAADMYRCGFDEQDILDRMIRITGTLDFSDKKTIQSAIKNEERNEGISKTNRP